MRRCSPIPPVVPPVSRFPRCAKPRKSVITVNGLSPDANGNVNAGDVRREDFSGVEPKEKMTLNEVGAKVNEVIGRLGGAADAAAESPSASGYGPGTHFGDVHPDTALRDVVEAAGMSADDVRAIASEVVAPVATSVTNLQETKLDRSDVVDPAVATEAGKAADAKKTQDELTRISGAASDAMALAESKADLVGGKVPVSQLPSLDDTVTGTSQNGVKSSGIWSWVKSLLPRWLTSDYAEPATVASVANKLDRIVRDPLFEHNHSEFKQTLDGLDYTAYQTDGGETEVLDIAHIGNKMVYVTEDSNWFTSGFHASEDYRGFGISKSSSDFKNGNFSTFYGDGFIDCGENEITIPNATGTMALMSTTLSGYGITDGATKTELAAAVSTNNPAFVSAVQNTPTENIPEDMPTDWGTYGTVGAAFAALAAFVKWAKAKIVAVIGDDRKPTDQFATDLLGKQVANVKANTVSLAAAYSETETYAVGDAVTHDGKLYKCAIAITTAEAWTPAHWTETTVATLWNNADTTSYGGQN